MNKRSRNCPYRPMIWKDLQTLQDILQGMLENLQEPILRKLNRMERLMSALSDVLADLNDATNLVAEKVEDQTAKIAELSAQLAEAQPGSEEAARLRAEIDSAVTAIGNQAAFLREVAADEENPVPDAPADEVPADPAPADPAPVEEPAEETPAPIDPADEPVDGNTQQ